MPSLRFKVPIRDVPPAVAARALGLTLEAFREKLPALAARGFPAPDPSTGNFDLRAIEKWQDARHPQLFPHEFSTAPAAPSSLTRERLKMAHR